MTTFSPDLVAGLKRAVGKSDADGLLPRLEDIVQIIPTLTHISESNLKGEREDAAKVGKEYRNARQLIDRLLKDVAQLAVFVRYDDEYDVMVRDVNDFRSLLQDLRAKVGAREATAHVGTAKKRGRSSHVRRHPLALAVGKAMTAVGIPLTKGVDGKYAKVLSITYEAAGIDVPVDLFRDIGRALADKKANLQHARRLPRARR